jgi:thiosulfate/3-mercaptopyruvate sulfurtransferase
VPSPLVTAAQLQAQLEEDAPTLLDVRWELATGAQRDAYRRGHVAGAAFVDLDLELSAPPGPAGRHPLPTADQFTRSMRAAGVSRERAVVVYDAGAAMAAARGWWLLRYFGHRAVRVLDGGLMAWTAAGGELWAGSETPASGDFVGRAGGMPVLDATSAAALAQRGVLLDARAPERFRGEVEPIDRVGGHIPRARNRPAALNLQDSGRFADPVELRDAFERLGAGPEVEVGTYCGSGISAAQQVLALDLAGISAALYPGSWSEWTADPSRPVQTGP